MIPGILQPQFKIICRNNIKAETCRVKQAVVQETVAWKFIDHVPCIYKHLSCF